MIWVKLGIMKELIIIVQRGVIKFYIELIVFENNWNWKRTHELGLKYKIVLC